MDYLGDIASEIPAGDQSRDRRRRGLYEPSELPGFVNPVVDGEPDLAIFIPEEVAGTEDEVTLTREEAEASAGKKRKPVAAVMYGAEE